MVLSMERWVGKVAIVTGASSGIGAAIAEALVKEGLKVPDPNLTNLKVVGLARRLDLMEDLTARLASEKGQLYAVKCDVSRRAELEDAFAWTGQNLGPVHVLVNNAGLIRHGPLIGGDPDDWREVFDVNVMALLVATDMVVKAMRENGVDGHVVQMNSVGGHYVPELDGTNVYPASKHAVTAITDSLRKEFTRAESRIKITSISPGIVATDIFKVGNFETSKMTLPFLHPEDVADAVVYALSTPPHVQVSELTIRPIGEPI